MKRPQSAKIYIKIKKNTYDFMWANIGPDGSVMMGFCGSGSEKVNFILDKKMGHTDAAALHNCETLERPKITFHKSGHYKLSTLVGLNAQSVDRGTISGTPLSEINEPRRMMEVLLPKSLQITMSRLEYRDIVLDASQFPERPLRCTISCIASEHFHKIMESNSFFVDTSDYEFTRALENGEKVWAWTLRVSREDKIAPNHFHYFLQGEFQWGKLISEP